MFTAKDPEAGRFVRHSAEHVMADAVKRLWPEVEIDVGRVDHSEKFQYDFRRAQPFTPDDLEQIEAKMREILSEGSAFERIEVSREEAASVLRRARREPQGQAARGHPRRRADHDLPHGEFFDLCRGPHVRDLTQIGAVKLLEASRGLLEGRREERAAAARLRHRVLVAEGSRGVRAAHRGGGARATTASSARSSISGA